MEPSTNPKHLVLVHKRDTEGAIHIDYLTGAVTTEIDERPDWAEGLTNALPRERESFYKLRLGDDFTTTETFKNPTALAFEDLSWIGVDGEGGLLELEADAEIRSEIVREFLVIDEETGEMVKDGWKTVAEAEIALDNVRNSTEFSEIATELEHNLSGEPVVHHDDKKAAG